MHKNAPYLILLSESHHFPPVLREALERLPHEIYKTDTIESTITLIQDADPAVVLFENTELSVKTFCEQLNFIGKTKKVPLLVLKSAPGELEDLTNNGYLGWIENLSSSFSSEFLYSKISTYLRMFEINQNSQALSNENSKVVQEQKNLKEKLNEAQNLTMLGRLASGVAHDFNNILGGILGYAEMARIRYGKTTPDLERYTKSIISFTKRAGDLTKEILTFASPHKEEKQVIDSHKLLEEVIDLLKHLIDKKYQVIKDFKATNTSLIGHASQLQNALINLALNAKDAMSEGGSLTFKTEDQYIQADEIKLSGYELEPGLHLIITVEDTGEGMDEYVMSKMFTPFFTTKEKGKGTGLGLPSVIHTVEELGGAIRVNSALGQGTKFELIFPVVNESNDDGPQTKEIPIQRSGERILVVDDEEALREIISEMLVDVGYRVNTAADGMEALEFFKKNYKEIDLVILDMNLPKKTGKDCFTDFKEIKPDVKAILSTGFSMNEQAKLAMDSGMMAFIQKPFEMNQLLKIINKVLHKPVT